MLHTARIVCHESGGTAGYENRNTACMNVPSIVIDYQQLNSKNPSLRAETREGRDKEDALHPEFSIPCFVFHPVRDADHSPSAHFIYETGGVA